VQHEVALVVVGLVAGDAVLFEDRLDVAVEIDLQLRGGAGGLLVGRGGQSVETEAPGGDAGQQGPDGWVQW